MAVPKELVLYYNPNPSGHVARMKGVFVQMGIRIKNVTSEEVGYTVGCLAGIKEADKEVQANCPEISDEMLVMKGFSSQRVDQLLLALRKAKVPKINLKAVVTDSNRNWSFYKLYEEIKKEHEEMSNETS